MRARTQVPNATQSGYGARAGLLAWMVLIVQVGCGQVDPDASPRPGSTGAMAATSPASAGASTATGAASHDSIGTPPHASAVTDAGAVADAGNDVETPQACATPHPGPSPLSRLGNSELNRSLRAFVPAGATPDELQWLSEASYENDPTTQLDRVTLERFHQLAHDIARLLVDDSSSDSWLASCDIAAEGETECRDKLTESLLERAYRRAVTSEDRDEMAEVFANGKALGGNFAAGMRAVAEVALLSPDFTYLIEQGSANAAGEVVELTNYETAARLSYFLTGAAPDTELFDAAKQDALDSEALAVHARRLLASPESRATVSRFYLELLGLDVVAPKPDLGFSDELAFAATEASRRFIEDVTFDGAGTFDALITEPSTWANGPLATFYGFPGVIGEAFQKVPLDPTRGVGLFAQPAFLAGASPPNRTSPVQRGLRILRPVLCFVPPEPPTDVLIELPEPPTGPTTTRQAMELVTEAAECQDCHRYIDPLGFAFEHFDAVGKWRDVEGGLPIDSSGELLLTDAPGPFLGAVELMQRLTQSKDVEACFVTQWLGHAYRRAELPEDACTKAELAEAFDASGGNILELLTGLAQTDNFKYRLKSELTP